VDLGDYRAVQVQLEIPPVTEEQVAGYLAQLQQENAQWVPVERPVALGDQVVMDVRASGG
jgi:FKBP-type peptidyl-prolyl cis-trans isomerase (trigger factor)